MFIVYSDIGNVNFVGLLSFDYDLHFFFFFFSGFMCGKSPACKKGVFLRRLFSAGRRSGGRTAGANVLCAAFFGVRTICVPEKNFRLFSSVGHPCETFYKCGHGTEA